jgi:cell division septation protein DedD
MKLDPVLKRRVMIAIIIVALVVIFVPVPFGRHFSDHQTDTLTEIPNAPDIAKPSDLTTEQANRVVKGFSPDNVSNQTLSSAPTPVAKPLNTPPPVVKVAPTRAVHKMVTKPATLPKTQKHVSIKPSHKVSASPKKSVSHHGVSHATSHKKKIIHHSKPLPPSPVVDQLGSDKHAIKITAAALNQKQDKPVVRHSTDNSSNAEISSASPVSTKGTEAAITAAKAKATAWVAQMASFPDEATAKKVVKQLQAKRFTAFDYPTLVKNKIMYRVYVGPFLSKASADKALKRLKTVSHMSGYVHHFDATDLR